MILAAVLARALLPRSPEPRTAGPRAGGHAGLDVQAVHETHADFVWRSLQRLGVRPAGAPRERAMSDPTRFRDDGPEEARALLRTAEPTRAITPEQRRRTAARVARYTALAAAGALSWLPGAALGAGLGVATVAVAWLAPAWLSPSTPAAPASVPPSSTPPPRASPPSAPPRPSLSTAPAPADLAPPAATPAAAVPASSTEPAAPADPLAEEAALLESARAALAASPARALALTRAHAARFPGGMLGMERDIVAVDALRRLGRLDEARALGEAVLARAPGSLYEDRVRKLLESRR